MRARDRASLIDIPATLFIFIFHLPLFVHFDQVGFNIGTWFFFSVIILMSVAVLFKLNSVEFFDFKKHQQQICLDLNRLDFVFAGYQFQRYLL